MKQWQWVLAVVVLFFVLAGGPEVTKLVDTLTNGPVVGPEVAVDEENEGGIIWTDPAELAAEAGEDTETYGLARCMASEHPNDPNLYLLCVGWAVKNKAHERGVSIVQLLTDGAGVEGDGYFGEQKASAGTKYASTAKDPHNRHVEVARMVVSGSSPDPTGGATHFFSPRAQDQLAEKAETDPRYVKYKGKDAAFIFASWAGTGLYPGGAVPVVPPGIDGNRLTLWRRA